jgi:ribose transport system permease protein
VTEARTSAGHESVGQLATLRRYLPARRFAAIWFALAGVVLFSIIFEPSAVNGISRPAIVALASFVIIVALGQALVFRVGGLDLSAPAVMGLSVLIIRNVGGGVTGTDADLAKAIIVALLFAAAVGLVNGLLVAVFKLNALIVTLAMSTFVLGAAGWYEVTHKIQSFTPLPLQHFGTTTQWGMIYPFFVAIGLALLAAFLLTFTAAGRRFTAAGSNPRAAEVAGIPVTAYQSSAYVMAAILYAAGAIMLGGFLGQPTLDVGSNYLFRPIVAVVLAGTSLAGGVGSMLSIVAAVFFLQVLAAVLAAMGQPTSVQNMIEGGFIILAAGIFAVQQGVPAVDYIHGLNRRLRRRFAGAQSARPETA